MIVYWSIYPEPKLPLINYEEPEELSTLINNFDYVTENVKRNFKYCPAVKEMTKNVYRLKFPFEYDLTLTENNVGSSLYDQEFFNKMVLVRSLEKKHLSFNLGYLFVCEESLEIESSSCHFSDNDFVNKTMLVPGKFNIGKWVRPLDCAFFMKNGFNTLNIKRGDDYSYVKFDTTEKIQLKKFYCTDNLLGLVQNNLKSRDYKIKPIEKLMHFYKLYEKAKMHKLVMREIKSNLME